MNNDEAEEKEVDEEEEIIREEEPNEQYARDALAGII